MKRTKTLLATLALTTLSTLPVAGLAGDELDDLDITMEVLDDDVNIDEDIAEMRGPEDEAGAGAGEWSEEVESEYAEREEEKLVGEESGKEQFADERGDSALPTTGSSTKSRTFTVTSATTRKARTSSRTNSMTSWTTSTRWIWRTRSSSDGRRQADPAGIPPNRRARADFLAPRHSFDACFASSSQQT